MEVWLLESVYGEEKFAEIFLVHRPSCLYITDTGYTTESVNVVSFTDKFWTSENILWTHLGEL